MATQDVEDSEMEEDEESQADGFVVDDGYLSAGEGGPIDNDDFGAEVEGRHPHSTSSLHLTDLFDAQLQYLGFLGNASHDKQRCTSTGCSAKHTSYKHTSAETCAIRGVACACHEQLCLVLH